MIKEICVWFIFYVVVSFMMIEFLGGCAAIQAVADREVRQQVIPYPPFAKHTCWSASLATLHEYALDKELLPCEIGNLLLHEKCCDKPELCAQPIYIPLVELAARTIIDPTIKLKRANTLPPYHVIKRKFKEGYVLWMILAGKVAHSVVVFGVHDNNQTLIYADPETTVIVPRVDSWGRDYLRGSKFSEVKYTPWKELKGKIHSYSFIRKQD